MQEVPVKLLKIYKAVATYAYGTSNPFCVDEDELEDNELILADLLYYAFL